MKQIVLNGKIEDAETGDECGSTIGIIDEQTITTFEGSEIVTRSGSYPLSKKINDSVGWKHKYAIIRFYTNKHNQLVRF